METTHQGLVSVEEKEEPAIYLGEERWELTWPIWHMLPRSDRKALAFQHGYKTIGEFEEYMSLQRAVGDSTDTSRPPYDNGMTYNDSTVRCILAEAAEVVPDDDEDDDDDEDLTSKQLDERIESESITATEHMATEELVKLGGCILLLPDELLHRIFDNLPVDAYATLALVSPHWKSFTRTEAVYKRLCERLYLNQSKRRALHVSRFGNSYRTMLEKRPRVRACGGVYVMKHARVKPIQRDMWTEVPIGAVLETVYYRYLYFQEDGRVLYALSCAPPHEMFRRFVSVCLHHRPDKDAVWGTYQVQKRQVTVVAKQEWQWVRLELSIELNSPHGRYGCLSFDRHVTSLTHHLALEDWCPDHIELEVPSEPFRFVQDRRL